MSWESMLKIKYMLPNGFIFAEESFMDDWNHSKEETCFEKMELRNSKIYHKRSDPTKCLLNVNLKATRRMQRLWDTKE